MSNTGSEHRSRSYERIMFWLTDWKLLCVVFVLLALIVATLTGRPPAVTASSHDLSSRPTVANPNFSDWTTIGFLSVIGVVFGSHIYSLWKGDARESWRYFRLLSLWPFLANIPVIGATICMSLWLNRFEWLDRSWLYHLHSTSGNVNTLAFSIPVLGVVFFVILLAVMPDIVCAEERVFRRNTDNWREGILRSLLFGLMHCFAGVNLSIGLALTIPGLWFTLQYFRGGLDRSIVHHLSYNLLLMLAFAAITIASFFS